jgi:hypothetical protein
LVDQVFTNQNGIAAIGQIDGDANGLRCVGHKDQFAEEEVPVDPPVLFCDALL